ncbi:hypothetical protein B0O80DRAFT_18947 [Mortierella sp. GBAus27b]|nr:hypothetical protein B0O80DRAFT_18947 [Mortierella sp. GBAus27b]
MLQLDGFTSLRSTLLKGSMLIIALSTILHTLFTVKILIAVAMCTCSICCLGRLRKAMDRDLKTRITDLVISTCGRNDTENYYSGLQCEIKRDGAPSAPSLQEVAIDCQRTGALLGSEKSSSTIQTPSMTLDILQCSSQDSLDDPQMDLDAEQAFSHHNTAGSAITVQIFPPTDALTSDTPPGPFTNPFLHDHNDYSYHAFSSTTQPTMFKANSVIDGTQSAPRHSTSTILPIHGLNTRRPSGQSDTNRLTPGGRFTALSFYDDLLKNINNERMIYATSFYNQSPLDLRHRPFDDERSRRESNNLSIEGTSIARCSSIPLTLPSCSEYDYRSSAERPVHPFDNLSQEPPSTTFETLRQSIFMEQRPMSTMAELHVHPLDAVDPKMTRFSNFPQTQSHDVQRSIYNSGLGRCGGPNSQETIENWRVLVEPRPPVIAELDYDIPKLPQQESVDEMNDEFCDSISRRGTIPIILSSHLRETPGYQEEQDLYFTAEDLHVPRPFYAYGQTRTQRQGSLNSSIGGYNCSVASSPSLADSLSNPMYHQQSYGIANFISTCSRPFPPRKCSLPSSIYSTIRDEAGSSTSYLCQPSSVPSYLAYPLTASRTRARTPSHLSNMFIHDEEISHVDMNEHRPSAPIQKKTHQRSQSQGARSSSQTSPSSWDSFEPASLVDPWTCDGDRTIPNAETTRPAMENGLLATDLRNHARFQHTPLDHTPLSLRRQSGNQQEYMIASSFTEAAQNEQYVGLGLTFCTQAEQSPSRRNIDGPSRSAPGEIVPIQFNNNTTSGHHNWNRSEAQARSNMLPRLVSGLTTTTLTTELSDTATLMNPYQDTLMNHYAPTSHLHHNDMIPHQSQQRLPMESAIHTFATQEPITTSATLGNYTHTVHRQPSQRNKKNLIVNIVPLSD